MWPAIAGIGSTLVGGALGYLGAKEANAASRDVAREQMGFQERMSNTAWQRATEDMRKAGINPMLAFAQGGASTPQGSTATVRNAVGAGLSSAMQAKQLQSQLANVQAQTDQTKALTALLNLQMPEKAVEAAIYSSLPGKIMKGRQTLFGKDIDRSTDLLRSLIGFGRSR